MHMPLFTSGVIFMFPSVNLHQGLNYLKWSSSDSTIVKVMCIMHVYYD